MGFYAVFQTQKRNLKEQMFSKISSGDIELELETFEFSTTQFEKIRKDRNEIYWQGKMYDIVTCVKSNHLVKVVCINDKNEELLFASFHKLVKTTNAGENQKNNSTKNLFKILTQLIIEPEVETKFSFIPSSPKNSFFVLSEYSTLLSKNFIPPQVG